MSSPIFTVAEAFEAAIARGDLPLHWGDPARAPLWWCPVCQGTGRRHVPGVTIPTPCFACWDGMGQTASPPDLPALAAVAAFGADRLVMVERLHDVAFPGARIVWRVDDLTALLPAWERDMGSPGPMGDLMRLGAWPVGGGNSGPVHLVVHSAEGSAISA